MRTLGCRITALLVFLGACDDDDQANEPVDASSDASIDSGAPCVTNRSPRCTLDRLCARTVSLGECGFSVQGSNWYECRDGRWQTTGQVECFYPFDSGLPADASTPRLDASF